MKQRLIIGMGLLFTFAICFMIVLLFLVKGNPLTLYKAEDSINAYVEANYPDIKEDFILSNVSYSFKTKEYVLKATYKTQPLLSFAIIYRSDKTVTDTYQFDFIEGSNFLATISNRYREQLEKKITDKEFFNTFKQWNVTVEIPLHQLDDNVLVKLLQNEDLYSHQIFSVSACYNVETLDAESIASAFLEFQNYQRQISFYPVSYSLLLSIENGKDAINISGVVLENKTLEDLKKTMTELLKNPDQTKDIDGIHYEVLKKEI